MTMEGNDGRKDIVIIGAGIIGCVTAYYLTRHPFYDRKKHRIVVIEATRVAGGASGKAGGLLAVWAYPNNIVPLSFKLHQDLALEHGGEEKWGYRRVLCGNLEAHGRKRSELEGLGPAPGLPLGKRAGDAKKGGKAWSGTGLPKDLDWILPELVRGYEKMGGSRETAQVHPYHFTMALMRLAEEAGAELVIGSVTDINYTDTVSPTSTPPPTIGRIRNHSSSASSLSSASSRSRRKVESITYIDKETQKSITIPATHTILAAGPWTANLFPTAPITGLRAHSVTITPAYPVSGYALFTEITIPSSPEVRYRGPVSPEIYARPNNEIYVCGEGDMDVAVPETTADVQIDEQRCDDLIAQVSSVSDHIRLGRVTRKQACYLPVLNIGGSGGPLIGETGTEGLYLATGHSCWGINNAPATGLLLAEMIFEGKTKSADIRQLDPKRIL
ncbi:FAD dependent oxidoreductase [Wilcoxina mikolae CBS 423.85]|nr:FAD dependent oxidoreductase [Wilcoxina mikolae CBS 423.85]